jgi:hypothetical protein
VAKAIHQSEKESYQLVTFQYGDPASPLTALYTDWAQAVEGGYVSVPGMEIDLPPNHGTFQESKLVITLPLEGDAFVNRASKVLPHSPIYVRVDDVTKGTRVGDSASVLTFFRGRVVRSIRNKDGKPDLAAFECLTRKARLEAALGLSCNSHCTWGLFGPGCRVAGLTQGPHDQLVTLSAATGKVGTITTAVFTAPTSPGGTVTNFWDRGYFTKDGIVVAIRDWKITDPTQVHCRRTIPPEWVGTTVLVVPGCHKTIEDCRAVWDNEEAAGHFGYAMQDYNPFYEDPQ